MEKDDQQLQRQSWDLSFVKCVWREDEEKDERHKDSLCIDRIELRRVWGRVFCCRDKGKEAALVHELVVMEVISLLFVVGFNVGLSDQVSRGRGFPFLHP